MKLRATGVSAGYGESLAVRELDLEVCAGQVVGLFGANGAGKTTTLLALAGGVSLAAGEVALDDARLAGPLHRRVRAGLGWVPEDRGVLMSLSVADNLRLGRGDPQVALDLFPELAPLRRRRAGLLSGGEQQMLAVGRALASRPRVLLIDELSLGLAPQVVDRLLGAVRAAADDGMGVLLVEQHVAKALEVIDHGYVLHRGRVRLAGPADALRDAMQDVAASYFGERGKDV